MRKSKKFFDEKIKEIAKLKVVFDVGGATRFQKALAPYKEYFVDCDYKTIDIDPEYNPDIVADVHNLPIPENTADGVICKSVLEHVKNPFQVVDEIYRILKPGGKCFVSVPFLHAYHGSGDAGYKDYWRFSEDAIKHIFGKFQNIEFCPEMGHFETMANLLPYQNKFPINIFVFLCRGLDILLSRFQSRKQTSAYYIFLVK